MIPTAYARFLEAAPDAIVVVDGTGTIVIVNAQTEKLFGYCREDILGKPLETLVPGRFRGRHVGHRTHYFSEPQVRSMGSGLELYGLHSDGTEFPVEISLSPIDTEKGRLVASAIRDLSERKKAEDQFRGLLEAAPDAMVIVGSDGLIRLVNAQTEHLFGYRRDELIGQPVELMIPERYRARHPALRGGFFSSPMTRPMGAGLSLFGRRRDGSEFPCEIALSPLGTGEGSLVTAAIRDVTERKQAEAALRKHQERVFHTDRLSSLGALAAGVAHEINNPLAYVMVNLELVAEEIRELAGTPLSSRMTELANMVSEARHGAERVRKIVRGLRTFSRADAEKRVVLDLQAVLETSINMVSHEIKHRARLVKDYHPVPLVEADEARLGQVFVNLLVNGAQAIREGQADRNEIRIITRTNHAGGATVEIRDTGGGIDPEALERIFDPFFTTKTVGIGTGLGLAICHGIVTALGGEIGVESTLGKGAAFTVTLPPAKVRDSVPAVSRSLAVSGGSRARILIVDDEESLRASLSRALRRDHDVVMASNGREALVLLAAQRFDVILCDLMMPELTGMDVHAELSRTDPATAERMVFMTGGAVTPHARDFLDRVPNARFEKPFDIRELRPLISRRT